MERIVVSTLLIAFSFVPALSLVQTTSGPMTRQELVSQLKDSTARRTSQADIATEIKQRGISFAADEKTLAEFRQLGARSFLLDAIKEASRNPGKPGLADPEDEIRRQPGDDTTDVPLLEEARQHALQFSEELPNFIVTQICKRYVQVAGDKDWRAQDTLEIELTYRVGKGEEFKLLKINGKPVTQSYADLEGSTSTGEFGTLLAALFARASMAEFKEVKREPFRGRPAVIFDFKVKKANSTSTITDRPSGQKIVAGYTGSAWIDLETKHVLRIEESNFDIPAGFPVSTSENAVEYDWVTIGDEKYLLPVRGELLLGLERDRYYSRNVIEFRNYRKFEGKIKMDPN